MKGFVAKGFYGDVDGSNGKEDGNYHFVLDEQLSLKRADDVIGSWYREPAPKLSTPNSALLSLKH